MTREAGEATRQGARRRTGNAEPGGSPPHKTGRPSASKPPDRVETRPRPRTTWLPSITNGTYHNQGTCCATKAESLTSLFDRRWWIFFPPPFFFDVESTLIIVFGSPPPRQRSEAPTTRLRSATPLCSSEAAPGRTRTPVQPVLWIALNFIFIISLFDSVHLLLFFACLPQTEYLFL